MVHKMWTPGFCQLYIVFCVGMILCYECHKDFTDLSYTCQIGENPLNRSELSHIDYDNEGNTSITRQTVGDGFQTVPHCNRNRSLLCDDVNNFRNTWSQENNKTTKYHDQVIVILQEDSIVQESAINLFYRHPDVSSIYKYDVKKIQFSRVAAKQAKFGKHSKIQLVGHGSGQNEDTLLANYSGHQLAEVVSKLPGLEKEIGRVSLVGCNTGRSEKLLKNFLTSMKHKFQIITEVSGITGILEIPKSGRKMVGKVTTEGLIWYEDSPLIEIIVRLDKKDNLVKVTEHFCEREKETFHSSGKWLINNVRDMSDIKEMIIIPDSDKPAMLLKPEVVDQFLTQETKKTFKDNFPDLVPKNKYNKKPVGNAVRIDTTTNEITFRNNNNYEKTIIVGCSGNLQYVQRYENNGKIKKDLHNVRHCKDKKAFLEEVNFWGLIGPIETLTYSKQLLYYDIGNYIYKVDLFSFYIGFYGVKDNVKWPWQNGQGKNINYEYADLKDYPDLFNRISKGAILNIIETIFEGNFANLQNAEPVDIVFSMVVGFSESIRNFRNFRVLQYLIELYKDKYHTYNVENFLTLNPMTRGGSWLVFQERTRPTRPTFINLSLKNVVKNTGFYGVLGKTYADIAQLTYTDPYNNQVKPNPVLPREINVVQNYLMLQLESKATIKFRKTNENLPHSIVEITLKDLNTLLLPVICPVKPSKSTKS